MKTLLISVLTGAILLGNTVVAEAAPGHGKPKHYHAHVKQLPKGTWDFVFKGTKYWISGGIYYRKQGTYFITVKAPVGATVHYLPDGAVRVVHKGHSYFRHAGVYYRWLPKQKRYEIVTIGNPVEVPTSALALGTVLTKLPDGAYATSINGVQYFSYRGQYLLPTLKEGQQVYVAVDVK